MSGQFLGAHILIAGGVDKVAIPKIFETPKGENDEMDEKNLALLRELAEED